MALPARSEQYALFLTPIRWTTMEKTEETECPIQLSIDCYLFVKLILPTSCYMPLNIIYSFDNKGIFGNLEK